MPGSGRGSSLCLRNTDRQSCLGGFAYPLLTRPGDILRFRVRSDRKAKEKKMGMVDLGEKGGGRSRKWRQCEAMPGILDRTAKRASRKACSGAAVGRSVHGMQYYRDLEDKDGEARCFKCANQCIRLGARPLRARIITSKGKPREIGTGWARSLNTLLERPDRQNSLGADAAKAGRSRQRSLP